MKKSGETSTSSSKTELCFQPLVSVSLSKFEERERQLRSQRYFSVANASVLGPASMQLPLLHVIRKGQAGNSTPAATSALTNKTSTAIATRGAFTSSIVSLIPVTPFGSVEEELSLLKAQVADDFDSSISSDAAIFDKQVRAMTKSLNQSVRENPQDVRNWLKLLHSQALLFQLQHLASTSRNVRTSKPSLLSVVSSFATFSDLQRNFSTTIIKNLMEKKVNILLDAIAKLTSFIESQSDSKSISLVHRDSLVLLYLHLFQLYNSAFAEPEVVKNTWINILQPNRLNSKSISSCSFQLALSWNLRLEYWRYVKHEYTTGNSAAIIRECSKIADDLKSTCALAESTRLKTQGYSINSQGTEFERFPSRLKEDFENLQIDLLYEKLICLRDCGYTEKVISNIQVNFIT